MTANVKIPVASAENVIAVPLAAVFTEKNPDGGQMERFVYVQQGDGFEKRSVKVGVSDYTFAEIQGGLEEGEVVSLELPKEEREKKARQLATQRKSGGEGGSPGARLAGGPPGGTSTNTGPASGGAAPGSAATEKGPRKKGGGGRGAGGSAR
jgi:hypothetical protein